MKQSDSTKHFDDREQFSGVAVSSSKLVYVWVQKKSDFDAIDLPATAHPWKHDSVTTLTKKYEGDTRRWEHRVTSKWVESPIHVIFQWFDYRPVSELADPHDAAPGHELEEVASEVAA